MKVSTEKKNAIELYEKHVSTEKVKFFKKYGMDFVMGSREGSIIRDIDGKKELINLHCNGGVFNLGHRNSEIIQVIKNALDNIDIGNHHLISKERAELGKILAESMPGDLNFTVFGVSGGEAIDLALKIARGYTKRSEIISAIGGYHGHTGLALAAGDAKYREPFQSSQPNFLQVPFNDIDAIKKTASSKTAAIILETVPATLGMVIPTKEYMQSVRKFCNDNNIILIIDEVQSGLSRTGKLWAFEHFDIVPDIAVLGKGLSGGIYPISATVFREPLESVFHPDPFIHISTFGGSEIACLAAIKVLEISSSPQFLQQVQDTSEQFKIGFDKLINKYKGFLLGLRQFGLMMGIELKDDICGPILTKTAYDNGLLLVYANNDTSICQLLPPLTISLKEIETVFEKLDSSLKSAQKLRKVYSVKQKFDKYKNMLTGKRGTNESK